MKKKIIITLVVTVVIAGVSMAFWSKGNAVDKMELKLATLKRGDINEIITATGRLEALMTVEVGTQVSGVVKELYVDYNSQVKKGQLLARIDETPLLASLDQSKASVDNAQAEVDYQKANYERYEALYQKQLIAQSDYDLVVYNYHKALAALKNAQSVHDRNKINLGYASIYSPIDGIILDRAVDEGQTVAASFNTPTLFTIANDLTQMQVEANVDEADIGKLKEGQRIEFTVDAYTDLKFEGKVTEIRLQPVETSNVVTYTVIIDAPNPDKKLMPGMTASASFFVMEKKHIVLLPAEALYFSPSPTDMEALKNLHPELTIDRPQPPRMGERPTDDAEGKGSADNFTARSPEMKEDERPQMVWVKNGNTLSPKQVRLGDTDELYYEVLDGVQEGDNVIVSLSNTGDANAASPVKDTAARSPFMPQPPGGGRK